MKYFLFLFWAPLIAGIAVVVLSIVRARRRTAALGRVAARAGLEFKEQSRKPGVGDFALFRQGHKNRYRNFFVMDMDGLSWKIFDFIPGVRVGGGRPRPQVTVARAKVGRRRFPAFALKPEGLIRKVGHLLGMSDIDLDVHPEFSTMYELRGDDEPAIRSMFTPALIQFLEHREFPGVLEGCGNTLIYYRPGKRIRPIEMLSFIEEARAIVSAFCWSDPAA